MFVENNNKQRGNSDVNTPVLCVCVSTAVLCVLGHV